MMLPPMAQEFLNEFIAKRLNSIWESFSGGKKDTPSPSSSTPSQEEKEQRSEAMGIIWSNKLSPETRKKYIDLWSNPEFARFRDKAEAGLDKLLLAMKDGIFVDHMSKVTEEYPSPDGKKVLKKVTEFSKPIPKRGWKPEVLFLQCLENAAQDTATLKIFLEMITKHQIFERLDTGELGDIMKKVGDKVSEWAKTLAWIWFLVVTLSFVCFLSSFIVFVVSPGPLSLMIMAGFLVTLFGVGGLPWTVGQKLIPGGK